MGKRIIQRARGRGGPVYRVRKKAFKHRLGYPNLSGEAKIIKLIHSAAHTAPVAKLEMKNGAETKLFYTPAFEGAYIGQIINITHNSEKKKGDVVRVEDLEVGDKIYNIERNPGDGGKLLRAAGTNAVISRKSKKAIYVRTPSKKEIILNPNCRVQIGVAAGSGRQDKPVMKAGKKYYIKKAKSKLWPRTSAVKMNVIDHPFGSGRGKRLTHGMKGKIAKRNAPAGAKVGLIRPRRTGRKKK